MKTFLTMTLAVVLGVALTTTVSLLLLGTPLKWSRLSLDMPAEVGAESSTASDDAPLVMPQTGDLPVAVAAEEEYNFGRLRNKTMGNRHAFQVRNAGKAPLKFTGAKASCDKCTFIDLPEAPIAPGETGEVIVRWNVDTFENIFRQSAKVNTNDPEHEELRFVISGKVVRPLTSEPKKLVFSSVQVGQPSQAKVRMTAYFSDALEVVGHSLTDASTASYFEIAASPIDKDKLDEDGLSGLEVTVKIKPGLPVGPINQTLDIETNLSEESKVSIPISGEVVGSVTVIHKDWEREYGYLRIGHVKQSEGAKRTVNLLARGDDLTGLEFEPPEIDDPQTVKVSYGRPVEIKPGTLVRVPVTIEIPPGSPLVNHMGGNEAKMAEIVIPTNKAALGRVRISVRFAVLAD